MMIAFTTVPSYRVPATNTDYAIVNAPNTTAVPVAQPTVVIPRSAFIANTDTPSTLLPTFNAASATTPTSLFGTVPSTPKYVTVVAPAPRQVVTGLDATGGITPPLNTTPADLSSLSSLSSLPDASLSSRNTMSAVPTAGTGTGLDTNALTGLLANAFTPKAAPRSVVADELTDSETIKNKLNNLQETVEELKNQPIASTDISESKPTVTSTPRSVALSTENAENGKKKMTEKKNEVGKNQKGIKKPSNTDVN